MILKQGQQGTDGIDPHDDGKEDGEGHPETLGIGERVGDLAEADGAGHEADEIEGVKEIHTPDIAGIVLSWDQHQPQDRNRVGDDQRQQRGAHAPDDQEDDVIHGLIRASVPAHRER